MIGRWLATAAIAGLMFLPLAIYHVWPTGGLPPSTDNVYASLRGMAVVFAIAIAVQTVWAMFRGDPPFESGFHGRTNKIALGFACAYVAIMTYISYTISTMDWNRVLNDIQIEKHDSRTGETTTTE